MARLPKEHGMESLLATKKKQTRSVWSGTQPIGRFTRLGSWSLMKASQQVTRTSSGAQNPGNEKEEHKEQWELMDDASNTTESENQAVLQDVVETKEEGLQDNTVSVSITEEVIDKGLTDY